MASLDPLIPAGQAEKLAAIFKSGGADLAISWHPGGRELGEDDAQLLEIGLLEKGFERHWRNRSRRPVAHDRRIQKQWVRWEPALYGTMQCLSNFFD